MSSEEEKYKKLRESLHSLPRIKAKHDFDSRLFSRIKDIESGKFIHTVPQTAKENSLVTWLANLFRPSLVPAIGLTVILLAAVVVYFAYYNQLGKDTQSTQYSLSDKKDGFVIYVKKDGERIYDESAREITSADVTQPAPTTSEYYAPLEHSTDALSVPEAPKSIDTDIHLKDDRIRDEQKIEMEKGESGREIKTESKTDEGKMMKKGYIEKEEKEAPSNYERGAEDTGVETDDKVYDQKTTPTNETEESQQEINRVTERRKDSKKDSLKAKNKEVEQKDSIEK